MPSAAVGGRCGLGFRVSVRGSGLWGGMGFGFGAGGGGGEGGTHLFSQQHPSMLISGAFIPEKEKMEIEVYSHEGPKNCVGLGLGT